MELHPIKEIEFVPQNKEIGSLKTRIEKVKRRIPIFDSFLEMERDKNTQNLTVELPFPLYPQSIEEWPFIVRILFEDAKIDEGNLSYLGALTILQIGNFLNVQGDWLKTIQQWIDSPFVIDDRYTYYLLVFWNLCSREGLKTRNLFVKPFRSLEKYKQVFLQAKEEFILEEFIRFWRQWMIPIQTEEEVETGGTNSE